MIIPSRKDTRNAEMLEMRQCGARYREIAEAFGVSNARVQQICRAEKMRQKRRQVVDMVTQPRRVANGVKAVYIPTIYSDAEIAAIARYVSDVMEVVSGR